MALTADALRSAKAIHRPRPAVPLVPRGDYPDRQPPFRLRPDCLHFLPGQVGGHNYGAIIVNTKNPPPIRVQRRQPTKPPSFDFSQPLAATSTKPPPAQTPEQPPAGPQRIRLSRKKTVAAVNVTRPPWTCPFRILEIDLADPRGACSIVWRHVELERSVPARQTSSRYPAPIGGRLKS